MKRGFTLIELLVVIAIIAILAAILFPVFAQAKVSAKKTTNLSNTKQIMTSAIMYAGDSDDVSAPLQNYAYGGTDVYGTTLTFGELIYPYSKNYQLLRCPLDPNANDNSLAAGATTEAQKVFNWCQRANRGYNIFYLQTWNSDGTFTGKSMTVHSKPAETIYNVDSVWDMSGSRSPAGGGNWFVQAPSYWNSDTAWWFGPWAWNNTASWFQYGGAYDFVKGTVTMSFVDGHAKNMPTPKLWAGADPVATSVFDWNLYLWGGQP